MKSSSFDDLDVTTDVGIPTRNFSDVFFVPRDASFLFFARTNYKKPGVHHVRQDNFSFYPGPVTSPVLVCVKPMDTRNTELYKMTTIASYHGGFNTL